MKDTMLKVETLRWNNGSLEMIDQRKLPQEFNYISCRDAASVAEAIATMVVRGAPAIGVAAAYGVALEAIRCRKLSRSEFQQKIADALGCLSASRPTAINLFWALKKMTDVLELQKSHGNEQITQSLLDRARQMHLEDIRTNRKLGDYGAALLPDNARVMTHCNAGALATAGYGTALGVVRSAVAQGKSIEVIACETRPFFQGARLTAWEMIQENIPVTLITDCMAGYMMAKGEIDAVIVGADRVALNGDTANKIGTYMLAVLADCHRIPFYVACPTSTIDASVKTGTDIPIEERSANEVTGFGDCQWAAEGVRVKNPAFDVTPARLVSALITEMGISTELNAEKIQELVSG